MVVVDAFNSRTVAVFGLARSGLATCAALAAGGARVLAWDDGDIPELPTVVLIQNLRKIDWKKVDALVLSPGIPHTFPSPHEIAQLAKDNSVPIIGDTELLYLSQPEARFIGITGTNGKSTTTALTGHILKAAGRQTSVGGNLGFAALALEPQSTNGIFVLEMSSYQLDLIEHQRFHAAVILNVSPDHIDRHGDLDGYISAKERIFQNQQPGDLAIVGVDDELSISLADRLALARPDLVRVSTTVATKNGVSAVNGLLIDHRQSNEVILDLTSAKSLPGRHNWQNAVVAYALCQSMGLTNEQIVSGLLSFGGLEHRQEFVARIGKTTFINDSKATNADAASRALSCYDDIFWIVGGRSKEGGINELLSCLNPIRQAFLVGESSESFANSLNNDLPYTLSGTVEAAVCQAFQASEASDAANPVVLLSPACASFDQFPSFERRGEVFKEEVFKLTEN
jgi:UDP-N-acetylmuramoylalanine--D-glutamate ligase